MSASSGRHCRFEGDARKGVLEQGDLAIEHRNVDLLATAGPCPAVKVAQMPMVANTAAPRSAIDGPTLRGGPSGSPVRLMAPPTAWMIMSYAGWSRSGPLSP